MSRKKRRQHNVVNAVTDKQQQKYTTKQVVDYINCRLVPSFKTRKAVALSEDCILIYCWYTELKTAYSMAIENAVERMLPEEVSMVIVFTDDPASKIDILRSYYE